MYSSQLGFLAVADSSSSSDTISKVVFAIGSALIGAACSYVVAVLLARRNPRKQLSWDASTDRSMLSVNSDIRDNVNISYRGEDVSDLVAIKCRVSNTGNTVVKEEQLRFAFPDGTKIHEADFSPRPERELRASRLELTDLKPTERMFFIGQLEVGQDVSFQIMASGVRAEEWRLHHSGEGNVEFRQRDANRVKDEEEHIRPTVVIVTLFFIMPIYDDDESIAVEIVRVFHNEGMTGKYAFKRFPAAEWFAGVYHDVELDQERWDQEPTSDWPRHIDRIVIGAPLWLRSASN